MSTAGSTPFDSLVALDLNIHLADTHGALFVGLLISAMSVMIKNDNMVQTQMPISCALRIACLGSRICRFLSIRSLAMVIVSGTKLL